jgi:hypothetical protein
VNRYNTFHVLDIDDVRVVHDGSYIAAVCAQCGYECAVEMRDSESIGSAGWRALCRFLARPCTCDHSRVSLQAATLKAVATFVGWLAGSQLWWDCTLSIARYQKRWAAHEASVASHARCTPEGSQCSHAGMQLAKVTAHDLEVATCSGNAGRTAREIADMINPSTHNHATGRDGHTLLSRADDWLRIRTVCAARHRQRYGG